MGGLRVQGPDAVLNFRSPLHSIELPGSVLAELCDASPLDEDATESAAVQAAMRAR